jgi:hypothetical protein
MEFSHKSARLSAGYVVKGFFEVVEPKYLSTICHYAGGEIELMDFLTDLGREIESAWLATDLKGATHPWDWWVSQPLGRCVAQYANEAGNLPTLEWTYAKLDELINEYLQGAE